MVVTKFSHLCMSVNLLNHYQKLSDTQRIKFWLPPLYGRASRCCPTVLVVLCCKIDCEISGPHGLKMKIRVNPCSSVGSSSVSWEPAIFMFRVPWRQRQQISLNLSYLSVKLHGVGYQKTITLIRKLILLLLDSVLHTDQIMTGPAKFTSAVWPVTRLSGVLHTVF